MWDIIMQFIQSRGADRVITLTLIGLALLIVSIVYKFKPEKYILHLIYVLTGLTVLYPAYNYSIDYIEMTSAVVNADPAIKQALITEIMKIMQWHIWFPALFIIPAGIFVLMGRFSKN